MFTKQRNHAGSLEDTKLKLH